jgi:hypothetical protein
MKFKKLFICSSLFLFSIKIINAATLTATNDGLWTAGTTWSAGRAPASGDVIIIPNHKEVTISGVNATLYTNMQITVNGELGFDSNQKLRLDSRGIVAISSTGELDGEAGSKIEINGTVVWFGGELEGPKTFPTSALPIELINFTAKSNGKNTVLNWSTASEINNNFFTIEKTIDGTNFENAEIIPSKSYNGTSASVLNYSCVDNNSNSGVSYYRLKQTDFDGRTTYSEIVKSDNSNAVNFVNNMFPNPNNGSTVNLTINAAKGEEATIVINDIAGRVCYSNALETEEGTNIYSMDIDQKLVTGVYMITVNTRKSNYSNRLIVK